MKTRTKRALSAIGIALTSALIALAGCSARPGSDAERFLTTIPKPVDYKPISPERWSLPNGLQVIFYRDPELPLVDGAIYLRGGSFWEPQEKIGAVAAMGSLMRLGGAGKLPADVLDLELEKLSARIESQMGGENGSVSFHGLSTDLDKIFSIFADVLLRPRFDEDRINLWKGQALESVRRRKDNPGTVASIAFNQLLYGDSPYGRVTVDRDIQRIGRADLREMHARFVRPDGAILAITGNVSRDEVEKLVDRHFGSWKARGTPLPPPHAVESRSPSGIYFIELPFSQATVQYGQLGVPRLTEDHMAINVFNELFGSGGFSSRLMKRIRSDLGLVYGVYGSIVPGLVKGKNLVYLKTKAESVDEAIVESIRILEGMQSAPVTPEELEETKRYIQNSFVFEFDSAGAVVHRKAQLDLLEYPRDYDEHYIERIMAVEPSDVRQVAIRRWDPDTFVVVVVGDQTAYSSLVELMTNPPEELKGLTLRRVDFNQKLELGS